MRTGATTYSLLVLAFIGFGRLVGEAGTAPLFFQAPASVDEPYIQVTRVTVEFSSIQMRRQPRRATVVVQVMLRGQAPANSEANVQVGTYSTTPPGINVEYENPTRTVPLKKDITVVEFTVEAGSQTASGRVVVAASIGGATKGIKIHGPESPEDWHAELVTQVP